MKRVQQRKSATLAKYIGRMNFVKKIPQKECIRMHKRITGHSLTDCYALMFHCFHVVPFNVALSQSFTI